MKKSLVIILFLTLSLAGYAQQDVVVDTETELNEVINADKPEAKRASSYAKAKAKVIRINHKKSNEIISIKAYRKSLQVKVKTKKLC